jgi:hypothetical protein
MRLRKLYIILLLLALAGTSCQKELSYENHSGITGVPPVVPGSFTAVIDGAPWAATDSSKGAYILGGTINIAGASADKHQITMSLNDTVTGVYILNQSSSSMATYANIDSTNLYVFTSNEGADTSQAGGKVTVTAIDKIGKTISGTFSFKLFRDVDGLRKTVTQGVFTKLPYAGSAPSGNGTDTLLATLDGTGWIAQSVSSSGLSGQLAITGSSSSGVPALSLIMPVNVLPGAYALNFDSTLNYVAEYNPLPTLALVASSGSLTILQNDAVNSRIRGNFQFQGTDPTGMNSRVSQVTKGYFSVKYAP